MKTINDVIKKLNLNENKKSELISILAESSESKEVDNISKFLEDNAKGILESEEFDALLLTLTECCLNDEFNLVNSKAYSSKEILLQETIEEQKKEISTLKKDMDELKNIKQLMEKEMDVKLNKKTMMCEKCGKGTLKEDSGKGENIYTCDSCGHQMRKMPDGKFMYYESDNGKENDNENDDNEDNDDENGKKKNKKNKKNGKEKDNENNDNEDKDLKEFEEGVRDFNEGNIDTDLILESESYRKGMKKAKEMKEQEENDPSIKRILSLEKKMEEILKALEELKNSNEENDDENDDEENDDENPNDDEVKEAVSEAFELGLSGKEEVDCKYENKILKEMFVCALNEGREIYRNKKIKELSEKADVETQSHLEKLEESEAETIFKTLFESVNEKISEKLTKEEQKLYYQLIAETCNEFITNPDNKIEVILEDDNDESEKEVNSIFEEKTKGLSKLKVAKLKELIENVEYESKEEFSKQLEELIESVSEKENSENKENSSDKKELSAYAKRWGFKK